MATQTITMKPGSWLKDAEGRILAEPGQTVPVDAEVAAQLVAGGSADRADEAPAKPSRRTREE